MSLGDGALRLLAEPPRRSSPRRWGSKPGAGRDGRHLTRDGLRRRRAGRRAARTAPRLVERVVAVAALGRLHARRAARRRTRRPRSPRGWRVSQSRRRVEAALGEARAARVAVVDEDGQRAGVGVQGGRDAADVPAVAGREQRQQPDRGVLGGVRRAGQVGRVEPGGLERRRRAASTTPPWCAACARRQVERLLAEHLARAGAGARRNETTWWVTSHLAEAQPAPAPGRVLAARRRSRCR